jgi:E3 ubiquitin-protein ligase HUWE1
MALHEIAVAIPFAFLELPSFGVISVIDSLFSVADRCAAFWSIQEIDCAEGEELVKMLIATLSTALSVLDCAAALDAVIPVWMQNVVNFSKEKLALVIIVLRVLMSIESVQFVLLSQLAKHRWTSISGNLLSKLDLSMPLERFLIGSILGLASAYFESLNRLEPRSMALIDELMKLDTPFQQSFLGSVTTFMLAPRAKPSKLIGRDIPVRCVREINYMELDPSVNPVRRKVPLEEAKRILKEHPVEVELDLEKLPSHIMKDAFVHLTPELQSTVLHHYLPPRPENLSPAVTRFLLSKPPWVTNWIQSKNQLMLLPEHYLVLFDTLRGIGNLKAEDDDDQSALENLMDEECCQGEFLNCVMDLLLNTEPDISWRATGVLSKWARKPLAMMNIIGVIPERLKGCTVDQLALMIDVLVSFRDVEGFQSWFSLLCSDALLSAIPLIIPLVDEMVCALPLFASFDKEIPCRALQMIPFVLGSRCDDESIGDFKVLSLFSKEIQNDLDRYVQVTIDRILNRVVEGGSSSCLDFLIQKSMIQKTPDRRRRLLEALEGLIRSGRDHEFLGRLIDFMCPPRDESGSLSTIDTDVMVNGITMPKSSFDKDPKFWEVITAHMEVFENQSEIMASLKNLSKYPEVLPFSLRIRGFRQKQVKKIDQRTVHIVVRRSEILADSFNQLQAIKDKRILGQFRVSFQDEPGIDAGGVRRDWFTSVVRELMNPNYGLFTQSANQRSMTPNPNSHLVRNHFDYFKFGGRIIARAVVEGLCLDAHLTKGVWKYMLKKELSLSDLEDIDEGLYKSLQWIIDNDVTEVGLKFAADFEYLGKHGTKDLVPGGEAIDVTNENKDEYVKLMTNHRLRTEIEDQLRAFRDGFDSVIEMRELEIFKPNELDLLVCGVPEIDVGDFERNCQFIRPYTAAHPVILRFFNVLKQFNSEELAKLLLFMTGSSQVPVGGFRAFKESGRAMIIASGGGRDRFPAAHTCMNQLDLPCYETEEEMKSKLLFAISECNSFGFA